MGELTDNKQAQLERLCYLVEKINKPLRKRDQAFNRMKQEALRKAAGKPYRPRVKCKDNAAEYDKQKAKAEALKKKHKLEIKQLRLSLGALFNVVAMCPIVRGIRIYDIGDFARYIPESEINEIAFQYRVKLEIEKMLK